MIGIFEGEKTVTAAEILYPNLISTCYLHGVGKWNNADWEPLRNREVIPLVLNKGLMSLRN